MTIEKVHVRSLRGWTDGPKVVIDYFAFWRQGDLPEGVHLIRADSMVDIPATIAAYSPVATYYVTGYRYTIDALAKLFPKNNFFELEDLFEEPYDAWKKIKANTAQCRYCGVLYEIDLNPEFCPLCSTEINPD